jgi:hypothetical protein
MRCYLCLRKDTDYPAHSLIRSSVPALQGPSRTVRFRVAARVAGPVAWHAAWQAGAARNSPGTLPRHLGDQGRSRPRGRSSGSVLVTADCWPVSPWADALNASRRVKLMILSPAPASSEGAVYTAPSARARPLSDHPRGCARRWPPSHSWGSHVGALSSAPSSSMVKRLRSTGSSSHSYRGPARLTARRTRATEFRGRSDHGVTVVSVNSVITCGTVAFRNQLLPG